MSLYNERYVCWDCEMTDLLLDQDMFDKTPRNPECPNCDGEMEFFEGQEVTMPPEPDF